jgi:DNA-binding MarR family transcriptional regulator
MTNPHPDDASAPDAAPRVDSARPQTSTAVAEPAPESVARSEAAPVAGQTEQQQSFLLRQLLEATPHHRLVKGEANRKIPAGAAREIGLTPAVANRGRDALAQQGYIRVSRVKQTVTYELTDAGREYLQTLAPYPPPEPEDETSEEIRGYQKAHLLLQLLRADQRTLARGQANRSRGPTDLELTTRAANRLRKRLAQEGKPEVVSFRTVVCRTRGHPPRRADQMPGRHRGPQKQ